MERTTTDAIFSGALRLEQPARGHGYRFNVDALLLVREALSRGTARRALDLGAGCGVAGLALLHRAGAAEVVLVERDPEMAAIAARNAGGAPRARVVTCAVEELPAALPSDDGSAFDLVLSNPPYTPLDAGPACPEPHRAGARGGEVRPFVEAAARQLAPQGRALFVYPAAALPVLLDHARDHGLRAERVRFVHPVPQAPARVVLCWFLAAAAGPDDEPPGPLQVEMPWFERDGRGASDEGLLAFLAGR